MTGLNAWAAVNAGVLVLALGALTLLALVLAAWSAARLRGMQRHYAVLTQGTDGGDLTKVLESHAVAVRSTAARVSEVDGLLCAIERNNRTHLQRTGFVRFNPFRDAGGDQSFALALADRDGNGVVLSSLHGRDGTRIYGKPLANWSSVYPLTDEERQVIEKARNDQAGS